MTMDLTGLARRGLLIGLAGFMLAGGMLAGGGAQAKEHKPDLADAVAGAWSGDVISDSQGSSRQNVTLTLTRVGPNTVRIDSDYPRLPVITVVLEKAMSAIVNRTGDTAFAFDTLKGHLDVSFHNEVSWAGERAGR